MSKRKLLLIVLIFLLLGVALYLTFALTTEPPKPAEQLYRESTLPTEVGS